MRIKQIEVTGLFGVFNHTIALKLADHITIIHGPKWAGQDGSPKNGVWHIQRPLLHYSFSPV